VPNHPADLGQHDCILRSYMAQPAIWRLISGENSVDVDVRGRLSTNNVSMTLRFVEQGYGIAPLAPSIARPAFDTGMGSTRALDDWSFSPDAGACGHDVPTGACEGQSLCRFPRQPPGRVRKGLLRARSLRTMVRHQN
jgi:DNA-binding transcriptional LysR family regulator